VLKEYEEFLAAHSPYDRLGADDVRRLARLTEVEFAPAGTAVVAAGSPAVQHVWVIRTGRIEIIDETRLVDELLPGDTFGHLSLMTGQSPTLTARAAEDTLLYRLPDPRTVVADPGRLAFRPYGAAAPVRSRSRGPIEAGLRPVSAFLREALRMPGHAPVSDVAAAVTRAHQSCALVDLPGGLGIVTDSDFRAAWGRGISPSSPVGAIATTPVVSVGDRTPSAQAFLAMVERGVHHLVVTDSADRPVGVVRVVDLASAEVRDPLAVRAAVEAATDLDQLAAAAGALPTTAVELVDAEVSPAQVAGLLAAVREAVVLKAITLTVATQVGEGTDGEPLASWMVLGSLARREPLPASDLDTALVWDDGGADPRTAAALRARADRTLAALERCGLNRCPDGANADNPLFSRSRDAWVGAATSWVGEPAGGGSLLLAAMLTDSRPITAIPLGRSVIEAMLGAVRREVLLPMLMTFTLASRPPTGFVRDFVVEHSGEHRGRLDLKHGGLGPVVALGRWAAFATGDDRGGTLERIERGAAAGVFTSDEAAVLAGAFELFYGLLLEQQVAAVRSGTATGTYLAPGELDSLTRRYLREAFREVTRVQARVQSEWVERMR
jgi:CBS domain-containing protein